MTSVCAIFDFCFRPTFRIDEMLSTQPVKFFHLRQQFYVNIIFDISFVTANVFYNGVDHGIARFGFFESVNVAGNAKTLICVFARLLILELYKHGDGKKYIRVRAHDIVLVSVLLG